MFRETPEKMGLPDLQKSVALGPKHLVVGADRAPEGGKTRRFGTTPDVLGNSVISHCCSKLFPLEPTQQKRGNTSRSLQKARQQDYGNETTGFLEMAV